MALSRAAKAFLTVGALLAVGAYLVIVDLGMFAGRIHEGVWVNKIDVGGMTREEAEEVLDARADVVVDEPVIFKLEGSDEVFRVTPTELGWQPRISKTVADAFAVGRSRGPLASLGDRVKAWTSVTRIRWKGDVDSDAIAELLDDWEGRAQALAIPIDRWKLRWTIRRSLVIWPRPSAIDIPLAEGS